MKNVQELEEALKVVVGIEPQELAVATENGPGIDTKDFDSLMVILNVGVISATGTLDVKLQQSSDDGVADAYTDITGAAFSQKVVASDQKAYVARLKCKNFERYIRVVAVVGTDVAQAGAVVVLGKYDGLVPVSQVNAVEFALDYIADGGTEGSSAT